MTAPPPHIIDSLLADHGQAIGSFAYLVLQHQPDAERILAATLATALAHSDLPREPETLRLQLLRFAAREILRGSGQTGEVAPLLPDPGSSTDRMPLLAAIAELDPHERMAVVLSYAMDLPADTIAGVLHDDRVALRSDLNDARNHLQARVGEEPPTEPFDARLRRALTEESARFRPVVDPQALKLPAPRHDGLPGIARRWWPLAILGALIAGLAGFLWFAPTPSAVPAASTASRPASASSAIAAGPITLANCQIAPADSPLAFRGWTTLAALDVHGGDAGPGQPIYAVITRGMAEWVGWQEHYSGPMYPPPIGRMGCIFDPSTHATSLVGVDQDWQPAQMADGCPPSPIDEFGGYRELGGPDAWLLLPTDASTWGVGHDNEILFRLSPPAEPGQSVTAWAQPLANAPPVAAKIGPRTSQDGLSQPLGSGSRYYLMTVRFSSAGCWVINIEVNGRIIGSAIAPITGPRLAQALPRRQGSR
jgi:DNA-directed RNA polymerase specialized sigma24 family protein